MTTVFTADRAPVALDDRHRYPGLRSFDEQDAHRFFGRNRAAEDLLLRVLSVRLLLQFAPSGAGKTSLLNAGLFPRLRPHGYFPCSIRLNNEHESLAQATARSLRDAARRVGLEAPVIPEDAGTLRSLLAGTQLWSAELLLLTPVLVFDQFEEVFTLRSDEFRRSLAEELGELSSGRPPDASDPAADQRTPEAKIIISLREEYLGKLEEMSAAIPELFRERLRLSPLTHDEAREAIVEPARLPGDWWSPPFGFAPDCLDGLIDFIDGVSDRVRVIEPLTLQLVCQRAEALAVAAAAGARVPMLTLSDFGGTSGLEHLVHHYYTTQLDSVGTRAARRRTAAMFEEGLLDQWGKRLMLEQGEIERRYGLDRTLLDRLVEGRLLRREPRNESIFYEISHDRLTEVIARHRSPRLPRWVLPAMAVAAVCIVVFAGASLMAGVAWRRAVVAQQSTASALTVLFGDVLGLRLREAGLSDALRDVLDRAPIDRTSDPLATALHLRRLGELAWERGTLDEAARPLTDALSLLDEAIGDGRQDTAVHAERAQILKVLGDVERDKGRITDAGHRYTEAVRVWDGIASDSAPHDVLSAAEARLSLGSFRERTGDTVGAEKEYAAAGRQALGVLMHAYERSAMQPDDQFVLGRAMQVYADAALGLARVWWVLDELTGARALAAGLLRLRPLSAQGRVQLGTASAILAIASVWSSEPSAARPLFEESGTQFRELTQFDPSNLRMRRELAAVQLLTSEGIAVCAEQDTCRTLLRDGELESAEAAALDSIGIFRQLAKGDPANTSLIDDIGWGLETQAKLMRARLAERRGSSAAERTLVTAAVLRVVDEALGIRHRTVVDASDLGSRSNIVTLLTTRGQVLADGGRFDEAFRTLDDSAALVEQLPEGQTAGFRRVEVLEARASVLTAMGRTEEARPLRAQAETLRKAAGEPWLARVTRARALNSEANTLWSAALAASGGDAAQYMLLAEKYLGAISEYPAHAVFWDNRRGACVKAAAVAGADTSAEAERQAKTRALQETGLRCALTSAWMAWTLSDVPTGSTGDQNARRKRLRTLYEDRRSLAMHLRNDPARVAEALALAEQGVREAQDHARQEAQSADASTLVADAYYGLAMMREEASQDGWEPAFRLAILHGERTRAQQPSNAERHVWLGSVRAELANRLDKAKRPVDEAAAERAQGIRTCQEALRLATTDDWRREAEACVTTATTARR